MLFATLHDLRSPARRILLFPQAWATDLAPIKGQTSDPYTMSTRRLLKLAARRYRVELRPVTPLIDGADEDKSASYNLASIYALSDLERAMVLQVPGMLLDTEAMDQLLAYAPPSPLSLLSANEALGLKGGEVVLLQPGKDSYSALRASDFVNSTASSSDVELLRHVLPEPSLLDPEINTETHAQLLRSVGTLHNVHADFDSTTASEWLSSAAYIRFSDPKLPRGPEWDVPWADRIKARPKNKDADWMWTKLYGQFAQERMAVCGLDLEAWRDWD